MHSKSSKHEMTVGSRAQVWHGTALKTSGGLTKRELFQNKDGRIVSKKKHHTAKKENRLVKHGYGTKKGHFGFVKLAAKGRSKKMRGGAPYGNSFNPSGVSYSGVDGQGITDYGSNSTDVQLAAGMSGGKRRHRRMKGGKGYGWLSHNGGIDGQGITNYGSNSTDVQLAAGMAGGKRRKRGGTMKRLPLSGSNPQTIALSAAA